MKAQQAGKRALENAFYKATPLPLASGDNGPVQIQVKSDKHKSGWMELNPAQMKALEFFLINSPEFYMEHIE